MSIPGCRYLNYRTRSHHDLKLNLKFKKTKKHIYRYTYNIYVYINIHKCINVS